MLNRKYLCIFLLPIFLLISCVDEMMMNDLSMESDSKSQEIAYTGEKTNSNLTGNQSEEKSVTVKGKAPSINLTTYSRSVIADYIYDVTNFYTLEDDILTFDSVRGPYYSIDLCNNRILECTSSNAELISLEKILKVII